MSQRQPTTFGLYLMRVISEAGYSSVAKFARAAGRDPSVVGRWIYGLTSPSVKVLIEVAPFLNVPARDLVAAAYPSGTPNDMPRVLPSVLAELADLLADDSPLPVDERQRLEAILRLLAENGRAMAQRQAG